MLGTAVHQYGGPSNSITDGANLHIHHDSTTMTSPVTNTGSSKIFYGWWMVMACAARAFFASGIFFRGFTVFVPAVRDSLGSSQAQTNLVFSVARAEGGLEGPVAGWAIDRFGNRAVLVPGIILAAIGYFVFAGWAFDHYGNFDLAIIPAIGLAGAASLCFFLVKKPPQLT